ncbi:MAG: hypothetical protein IJT83_08010, partial [Victivallales bacterium]|nr:hypothetical protein [Victivallales bacterium]
ARDSARASPHSGVLRHECAARSRTPPSRPPKMGAANGRGESPPPTCPGLCAGQCPRVATQWCPAS